LVAAPPPCVTRFCGNECIWERLHQKNDTTTYRAATAHTRKASDVR
jgi:hypothetical protein